MSFVINLKEINATEEEMNRVFKSRDADNSGEFLKS